MELVSFITIGRGENTWEERREERRGPKVAQRRTLESNGSVEEEEHANQRKAASRGEQEGA